MGFNEKMNIEIPGNDGPKIRHPKDKARYWSKTTLPWMSIGYESQIPPIYTLAFYNAIANNGKLIRPFFVKALMQNGQTVKTFSTETIRESICKPTTLQIVRETLLGVLEGEKGTAKNVRSKYVRIAGKTGTAQISKGALGYKAGGKSHQVSVCGYFPADNPRYTCIVVIREPHNGYPSGGKMAGSVFKSIAEQTMALNSSLKPETIANDTSIVSAFFPEVKPGNYKSVETLMSLLNLSMTGNPTDWVSTYSKEKALEVRPLAVHKNMIPELKGMGAKDAMFLLGQMGLKVRITGMGKVVSQTLLPGTIAHKGQTILLNLE